MVKYSYSVYSYFLMRRELDEKQKVWENAGESWENY